MRQPEYRVVIDLRGVLVRAADALADAADPGGAPLTYRAVEAEVRQLISALDQEAAALGVEGEADDE